jgi:hypothetical protein
MLSRPSRARVLPLIWAWVVVVVVALPAAVLSAFDPKGFGKAVSASCEAISLTKRINEPKKKTRQDPVTYSPSSLSESALCGGGGRSFETAEEGLSVVAGVRRRSSSLRRCSRPSCRSRSLLCSRALLESRSLSLSCSLSLSLSRSRSRSRDRYSRLSRLSLLPRFSSHLPLPTSLPLCRLCGRGFECGCEGEWVCPSDSLWWCPSQDRFAPADTLVIGCSSE